MESQESRTTPQPYLLACACACVCVLFHEGIHGDRLRSQMLMTIMEQRKELITESGPWKGAIVARMAYATIHHA